MPDPASQNSQPPMEPEKLDLRSMDIAESRRQELLRLFPEIRTEGGKLDFDRLKLALGEAVDVGRERYGMNWPGKADCFKTIQTPSMGTLRPCPQESVNWDATENLIIEGDNLEVLKLLQKSYLGKIKMIYIDPPYNTGSDFIYPDNYAESLETYLEYTGQVDAEGRKYGSNTEADGRFHSKWMNMMYPRLYLARNLLKPDGSILVSIGDTELAGLLALMNEVFGEETRSGIFLWKSRAKPTNAGDAKLRPQRVGEYVLAYSRLPCEELLLNATSAKTRSYPHEDAEGRYRTTTILTSNRGMFRRETMRFESGGFKPEEDNRWKAGKDIVDGLFGRNRIVFNEDGVPLEKKYEHEERDPLYPIYCFMDPDLTGSAESGKADLNSVVGNQHGLDTVKPVELLKYFCATFSNPGDLVLDFFAGSGTLGHAVTELNTEEEGNRRFILVQLPEPYAPDSEAARAGLRTIADLTKARLKAVAERALALARPSSLLPRSTALNLGFRVLKLDQSSLLAWTASGATDGSGLQRQMELIVDHIRDSRSETDLLHEILLKSGFPLTTPIETHTLADKKVYSVAGGALMLCLERPLTMEVMRAIADKKPERVVCLDAGFAGNDQLKTNAVQIFKTKGVGSFKTV
jgi:adenine-specific DNA-methyltransferase